MPELTLDAQTTADLASTWHAWTDAPTFNAWYWPERLSPVSTLDVRPGGAWRIESPVAEMAVGGEYSVVDEHRLLSFTWRWDGDDESTHVAVKFEGVENGCVVTVVHSGFATEADVERHVEGWTHCLGRMPG